MKKNKYILSTIIFSFFIILTLWWVILFFGLHSLNSEANLIWAASYQVMALFGGLIGIIVSLSWGGWKSVFGKSIMAFSIGLLLQVFGQTVFSYYNLILEVEIPYPSIADIGFFGSIPFYIAGIFFLGKVAGNSVSLRFIFKKLQAILIPLIMLVFSYEFFLRDYQPDWSEKLKVILDFGYPLGQAVYISIAILTFLLSKNILGGIMRKKVLLILVALVIQYIADYNFLFQVINETWINGGYGDYIYLVAYFLMALGLFWLRADFTNSSLVNKSTSTIS